MATCLKYITGLVFMTCKFIMVPIEGTIIACVKLLPLPPTGVLVGGELFKVTFGCHISVS